MPLKNKKSIKYSLFFASLLMVLSVSAENYDANGTGTIGMRIGEDTVEAYVDILKPVMNFNNSVLLFNPRASLKDEGENEVNIGLAYRYLLPSKSVILGANVYGDSRKSTHSNRFNQLGLGLELLSTWFDARVNWYDADSTPELINEFTETEIDISSLQQTSRRTSTQVSFGDPFARIHAIRQNRTTTLTTTTTVRNTTTTVQTDRLFQEFEAGLDGYDAEIGVKLPIFQPATDVRLFVGKYDFVGEFGRDIEGHKGRLEVRAGPSITFDAEVFEDAELNGTDYFVGARLHIPLHGKDTWRRFKESFKSRRLNNFKDRMYSDMVMRDVRVQMEESNLLEDQTRFKQKTDVDITSRSSSNTITNTENIVVKDNITFVDGDNNGGAIEDGTAENPWGTPQEGSDNAVGNLIFIHEVNSGFSLYTTGVSLQSNQTLTSSLNVLGGKKFQTSNRPVIAPDLGNVGVDLSGTENTAVNRLTILTANADGITTIVSDATGSTKITNNIISTIGDDAYGIFYTVDGSGTVLIDNNEIDTDGEESFGISVSNEGPGQVGNVKVTNNTVTTFDDESNGIEVLVDGFSSKVSNNNVTTNGDGFAFGIIIENDGDASAEISNNMITTNGFFGSHGAIIDSNGNGSSKITNNMIATNDVFGIGIVSDNEDGTGDAFVKNNTITTDGLESDGILLIGGDGSVSATNNSITTKGVDSFGIHSDIVGDGMTTISGNTILTMEEDSVGVFSETFGGDGAITINSNNITTEGDFADGITTISDEAGAVVISNNNVNTSGDGAEGVDTDNDGTGTTLISSNTIRTTGDEVGIDDADGIDSDNDSTGATIITNNTVTTTGSSAEGINTENDGAGAGASIITGNTVTTTASGSEGIQTEDQCSQISNNRINAIGGADAIDTTANVNLGNVGIGTEAADLQAANNIISGAIDVGGATGLGAAVACP